MFAASKTGKYVAATPPATSDTYFPYVSLLTETTSTNGQQNGTFLDSSNNSFTITRAGASTQGSVNQYWPDGYWSNYFGGTSDSLGTPANSSLNPAAGNFTIELWAFHTNSGVYCGYYWGGTSGLVIRRTSSNTLELSHDGIASIVTSSSTIPVGQWVHIAASRSGSSVQIFINGTSVGSSTYSTSINGSTGPTIGSITTAAGYYMAGYISNLRLLIGTALYTSSFTPPTAPLAPIANTQLLTCQSNRFIDTNTIVTAKAISANGLPATSAFRPFSAPNSYTTALYGGGGYFNGTTDYLSVPDNVALQFGTGDFTIEGWFYISGSMASTGYNLISKGTASTGWSLNTIGGGRIQFSYTASNLTGATTTLYSNSWYHFAVVRSGSSVGNLKIYINGVQEIASSTAITDNFNQTDLLYISASRTATAFLNGYSSNIRLVKGTAVYTGAFTPPTLAPITTSGSTSAASYTSTTNVNITFAASSTSLLTNFSNAGIYDAAVQNNEILAGSAQVSTSQSKWSPTSMKFNGTTDWISLTDGFGAQTNLAAIPTWTIECWIYNTGSVTAYVFCKGGATASYVPSYYLTLTGVDGSGQFGIGSGGATATYTFSYVAGTFPTAASPSWAYFAAVRSSTGVITTYVNGVLKSTSGAGINVVTAFDQSFALGAASNTLGTQPFTGYLQDFRITKGVARTITASPTAAFPTK